MRLRRERTMTTMNGAMDTYILLLISKRQGMEIEILNSWRDLSVEGV